jgi:hypothetical protein
MTGLPTVGQLRKLPLRAIVAYAVRCARRVQPLYRAAGARHRLPSHSTLDEALLIATDVCLGRETDADSVDSAVCAARRVARFDFMNGVEASVYAAADAAVDAGLAASSAAHVADFNAGRTHRGAEFYLGRLALAAHSAFCAAAATVRAAESFAGLAAAAALADYNHLQALKQVEPANLEMGDPIDPGDTGPLGTLWPDCVPPWHSR